MLDHIREYDVPARHAFCFARLKDMLQTLCPDVLFTVYLRVFAVQHCRSINLAVCVGVGVFEAIRQLDAGQVCVTPR